MMTLMTISEKNTKKQILVEHEKALEIIASLQNTSSPRSMKPSVLSHTLNIQESIKIFNTASDKLKDDMSLENSIILGLKEKIEEKKETIQKLYQSRADISIERLMTTHNSMIKEQKECFVEAQNTATSEIKEIESKQKEQKKEQKDLYTNKKDAFNLSSLRGRKEDSYHKEQTKQRLTSDNEALELQNSRELDTLKESYENRWIEVSKKLEANKKVHHDVLSKASKLKETFDKELENKVASIIGRQKANNTYALRDVSQEYNNKITLQKTKLENLKAEENILNTEIAQLQSELSTVQEKAHILATKTIESKSTTQAFDAMREVAMEQAKGKK
jgi:hypothetical protein